MNLDITSLFPDLEALTPDGRWNALQDWLKDNPEYGEKVDRWAQMSVDQVCDEITILVIGKYGGIAVFVMQSEVGKAIKEKVRRTVEILQACYRERAGINNQTEKEIKNVSTRMDNRCNEQRAIGKRKANTRASKRTDQP